MPLLRNCTLEKYEKLNFKLGKYFKNNGANGLLLNFFEKINFKLGGYSGDNGPGGLLIKYFLKSTEFAAYGERLPTAYSLWCAVLVVV